MKKYERPVVIVNSDFAEGVYAASGGSDCYTVNASIRQTPEPGRDNYVIQINGSHSAPDNHTTDSQTLTINFNQPVTYISSNGNLAGGDGTASLQVNYVYHNNGTDNIGLGDIYVSSAEGLGISGCFLTCNH